MVLQRLPFDGNASYDNSLFCVLSLHFVYDQVKLFGGLVQIYADAYSRSIRQFARMRDATHTETIVLPFDYLASLKTHEINLQLSTGIRCTNKSFIVCQHFHGDPVVILREQVVKIQTRNHWFPSRRFCLCKNKAWCRTALRHRPIVYVTFNHFGCEESLSIMEIYIWKPAKAIENMGKLIPIQFMQARPRGNKDTLRPFRQGPLMLADKFHILAFLHLRFKKSREILKELVLNLIADHNFLSWVIFLRQLVKSGVPNTARCQCGNHK